MSSSSSLTLNLASDLALINPIQGDRGVLGGSLSSGGLNKRGPARLSLSGNNTYTGPTIVEVGELEINGSVISDITVNKGGVLSGNVTIKKAINSGSLTNSGIVNPGTSGIAGTITLEGNYIQNATGTLLIDITPTSHDKLLLTSGTAALDGTLHIATSQGTYLKGTQYPIINGSTETTAFADVLITGPAADNLQIGVTYGSVMLTVLSNSFFNGQVISWVFLVKWQMPSSKKPLP